jgi:hypothetical protein
LIKKSFALGIPSKIFICYNDTKGETMTDIIAKLVDNEPLISQDMADKYLAFLESSTS